MQKLALETTANLKDHENKGSDEGIKLPFLHLTMPTEYYLVPKPLVEGHLADRIQRSSSYTKSPAVSWAYIFEYEILTVEIEKFAWCSGDGIVLPFGPSLCWINAPLHCPENEQPPQYKQQQNLHRSSHHRHVGRFSTHNPVINAVVQVSSSESV